MDPRRPARDSAAAKPCATSSALPMEFPSAMHFLVHWDVPDERDLLEQYLAVDPGDTVRAVGDFAALLAAAERREPVDCVLLAISEVDRAYEAFIDLKTLLPDVPVLGICAPDDVFRVARFLTAGMRSYLLRDARGDFLFMVRAMLERVCDAAMAERKASVAETIRQEVETVEQWHDFCRESLPAVAGYDLAVSLAERSGGSELCDVVPLADGRVALLVADTGGHGMKATLSLLATRTLATGPLEPGKFVAHLSATLREQAWGRGGGLVTLLIGVLDPKSHELVWCSAGYATGDLCPDRLNGAKPDCTASLPLGVADNAVYKTHRRTLGLGESVQFGDDRASVQITRDD